MSQRAPGRARRTLPGRLLIAIDGPAASGKSTTARLVARRLRLRYVDTGAMYRAITLAILERDPALLGRGRRRALAAFVAARRVALPLRSGRLRVLLDGRDVTRAIRSAAVTARVSEVSAIPVVRRILVGWQRRMGWGGGIVMEGRDIGTVVFPRADLKVYVTASLEERARRRLREARRGGVPAGTLAEEMRRLQRRDRLDRGRRVSPLRPARDAMHLDTTRLSIPAQVATVCRAARARMRGEA